MNIVFVDPIAATANVNARAFLRPQVPSLASGSGALREAKLVELASAIANRGHRATVLYGDVFLRGQGTEVGRVRVVPVETVLRVPFHPGLLPATPSLLAHPAFADADVIQASEFHQPSTFFACVAADARTVPLVVWQETFRRMRFPGSVYQRTYESTVGRFVRGRARVFVPRTTKARGYLRELRVRDAHIGPWVPTGVDVRAFAPRRSGFTANDFGWPSDARVLLLVARLHPTKGVDLALRVLRSILRRHPEVRLVIRGTGPEEPYLRRLAKALRVEHAVRIVGPMSRAAMVDLYNLAEVVLNTSRSDLLPFSMMEAGACGRPCVATDVGAIRDIVVDGGTGLVVRERTMDAVRGAIDSLLRDEGLQASLAAAARRRAEHEFALDVVADRLLEVFRGVAS